MIAAETVALILLAAGRSTRFGPRDKLAEPLDGLALGLHAARMFGALPFAARIAVTRAGGPDFAPCGFATAVNADPDGGQSCSIRLGLARARQARPEAVLIALADMPFVTTAHIAALLARFDAAHPVVGSTDGAQPRPPALFGAALFATLDTLSGDAGARTLLRNAALVAAPPGELADIDTPADLPRRDRPQGSA
jgi:molybdenum cofactor cytidylyltransferase